MGGGGDEGLQHAAGQELVSEGGREGGRWGAEHGGHGVVHCRGGQEGGGGDSNTLK